MILNRLKLWKAVSVFCLLFSVQVFSQGSPNVSLFGQVNDYPTRGYSDCWGYTAPDGREYAILGVTNGVSIIDITDNVSLGEVAFIPGPSSSWRDIKTYQNYAYVVNESSGGMQIIDLSNLPASASIAATYTGFSTSHNIFIDVPNGILYAEGGGSQPVRVLSLADPLNPVQISSFGIECHDIYVQDNLAFVSEGSSASLGIYDVTNPQVPSFLARINFTRPTYVHNAWATEDGNYLMTTEETSGRTMKMWDISNLGNITMTDEILGPSGLAHNTHIMGNFAYVSHYADGLRIIDVSDPFNLVEVGFYDTYPNPGGGFNGAWGAFPFFPSGKILISDIQTGLYVVTFDQSPPPPSNGFFINAGGADFTDSNGNLFVADQPFSPGGFGYIQGTTNTFSGDISGTTDDPLYQSMRGAKDHPFRYNFDALAAGNYQVTLYFAEPFFTAAGQRVFDVTAEGNLVLDDFDIVAAAGARRVAHSETFTVNVTDGRLSIDFLNVTNSYALVNAIAVVPVAGAGQQLSESISGPREESISSRVETFHLAQNYPNPFNPSTTIAYQLPAGMKVTLRIYDITGQEVTTLVDDYQSAGNFAVRWDGTKRSGVRMPSGVYIYELRGENFVQARKMALVK